MQRADAERFGGHPRGCKDECPAGPASVTESNATAATQWASVHPWTVVRRRPMVEARTRALPIAITAIATLAVTVGLANCGPSHCQSIEDIQQLRPAVRDYPQEWPQGSMTIAV